MNRLRRHATYRCSFCDKSQEKVQRLIAGPGGVFICDECIRSYTQGITTEQSGKSEAVKCSFCGKKGHQVQRVVAGPRGVYICDECLDLCCEILDEEQSSGSRNV